MRYTPFGYKFMIDYIDRDGNKSDAMVTHYWYITDMIRLLLEDNARNIVITDATVYIDMAHNKN